MSEWKAKRFWKTAEIVALEDGFGISLDGRPVKTPAKRLLELPTQPLALAVVAEWNAQDGVIDPRSMPFTRTANAAIDKVATQHGEVAELIAAYGDSDLLCYRAISPEELVARQACEWDPMLAWANAELRVDLATRSGVMHVPQNAKALLRLSARVHALSNFELAAIHDLVSLTGSLILGFAAALDAKTAEELWNISRLDEIWQSEQWGGDEEAEALAVSKKIAFLHARRVYSLCQVETSPEG